MEQFGLIAKFSPSSFDVKYFVPAQLKSSPKGLSEMEPSPSDPCPLYLHFVDGFVPHGLFSRLVSRSISWCSEAGCSQPPNLYQNGARFVIGKQSIHDLTLICKKRFIKISLKQRTEDGAVSLSNSAAMARQVRLFVEGTLQNLSQELPYLSGVRYEFCVACPYCLQGSDECASHSQPSCAHEDCLHLLEMKQGERLLCMKGFGDKVLTVCGLEKWFSQTTSQVWFIIYNDNASFQDKLNTVNKVWGCIKAVPNLIVSARWLFSKYCCSLAWISAVSSVAYSRSNCGQFYYNMQLCICGW